MDLKTRKIRATFFYLFIVGVLILASSLLVHRLIQDNLLGRADDIGGWRGFPFRRQRQLVDGVTAAVLHSEQTARWLAESIEECEDPVYQAEKERARQAGEYEPDKETLEETRRRIRENYRDTAEFWHERLRRMNFQATLIDDRQLREELHRYNLLVLPFAYCLSEEQVQAVKSFLEQRKGLIMLHAAGYRDEHGRERRGWSLVSDVVGGRPLFPRCRFGGYPAAVTTLHQSPLAANLPPGVDFNLHAYDQPMGFALREPRFRSAGFWHRFPDRPDIEPADHLTNRTALAYGHYLGGRVAWLGFAPHTIQGDSQTWAEFDRLVANIINWTAHRTVAGKEIWPGTRSAATFAVHPRQDFVRSLNTREIFSRHDLRPLFFLDRREAETYRIIMEQLVRDSDIGIRLSSAELGPEPARADWERLLRQQKNELENKLDVTVEFLTTDSEAMLDFEAIARVSLAGVWRDRNRRNVPLVGRLARRPFWRRRREPVVIHQSGRDERQLLEDPFTAGPEALLATLKNDFDRVHRSGALYSVALHADLIGSERLRPALDDFLAYLKTRDTWLASPLEAARRWERHENIMLSLRERGRRITVMVTNENRYRLDEAVIHVYPPSLPTELTIRSERINVPIPRHEIEPELSRIRLFISNLEAGESRTYFLDL